jgi:hypothetical protein
MINNEYFDLYHGSRDNAPDGLIDKSNVMNDIENIFHIFLEMEPYKRRQPALTAARTVEYVSNNPDATVALTTMFVIALRHIVDNDPTRSVKSQLQSMFNPKLLDKLRTELSALPYRLVTIDGCVGTTECEDYSVVGVLCDRFPLEYVIDDSEAEDQDFRFEIIDEADIEPDADEDDENDD